MKTSDLAAFPREGHLLLFSDTIQDDLTVNDAKLTACFFTRIGAKNAQIKNCALTQCLFEDSYLRKARFVNVDFTGSTFRNCNLEKASFQGCKLQYCSFHSTRLNHEEIIACLPGEPNLRRDLARNLRRNFQVLGDKDAADKFLDLEIAAHEKELLCAFRRKTAYYKTHYSIIEQVMAGVSLLGSKLSGLVWGYGHRVRRLLGSYLCLTLLLGLITYLCRIEFGDESSVAVRSLGFWESIHYTFAATLALGAAPLNPVSVAAKILQLFEGFVGTLFLALLAAASYRRIAR